MLAWIAGSSWLGIIVLYHSETIHAIMHKERYHKYTYIYIYCQFALDAHDQFPDNSAAEIRKQAEADLEVRCPFV